MVEVVEVPDIVAELVVSSNVVVEVTSVVVVGPEGERVVATVSTRLVLSSEVWAVEIVMVAVDGSVLTVERPAEGVFEPWRCVHSRIA